MRVFRCVGERYVVLANLCLALSYCRPTCTVSPSFDNRLCMPCLHKGASTSSKIAGNCVAEPSTLSKFPATRSKLAGNTRPVARGGVRGVS